MKRDFSPEEKLLRLIKSKDSKKKTAPKEEEPVPRIQPTEKEMAQLSRMATEKSTPKTAKAISISLPFKLRGINTRPLNFILIVVLIGLLAYLIYNLLYATYRKEETELLVVAERKIPKVEKEDVLETKPYSFYSSSIEGRNIFLPQQVEIEPVATGPTIEEVKANLSLIGIIAGDRPQAIIEDKKSHKSYFLYEDSTVGPSKVVEILEDSVVMEYKGQRFELVL